MAHLNGTSLINIYRGHLGDIKKHDMLRWLYSHGDRDLCRVIKEREVRERRQGSHLSGDGRPMHDFGKDMFDRHLLHIVSNECNNPEGNTRIVSYRKSLKKIFSQCLPIRKTSTYVFMNIYICIHIIQLSCEKCC